MPVYPANLALLSQKPRRADEADRRSIHQAKELGKDSPLLLIQTPSWDELSSAVTEAVAAQAEIGKLERRLKELYGIRDPYLTNFTEANRSSRDLLMGVHAKNPAILGDYGFDVIATAAPKSPPGAKK